MKKIIRYSFIFGFLAYILLPITTNIIMSLSDVWQWPDIIPKYITFSHYKSILTHISFWKALITTFIIAISVVILNYIFAIPASYILSRMENKYKHLIIGFILLPMVLPPLLILMNLYVTFIKFNLNDHFIGVIIAHMVPSLPYMFLILFLGFEKIDPNFEKQYISLGAHPIKGFFQILLPQLKESILLGGVLSFLISISQYLSTLFIGGGNIITLNLLLTPYISGGNAKLGASNATLLIIFCLVFILIYEKLLLGGQNA